MTNVVGTQTLIDAALAAGIETFVHVSTDEVYGSIDEGSWAEDAPARAQLAVLRVEGVERPDRAVLPPHPRPAGVRDPLLQQLRAPPVPREGHPAVRHQPARRREGPAVRRRRATSATGCTSTTTAGASSSCSARAGPGEVYNIGGGTELTNKELTGLLLDGVRRRLGASVEYVEDRKGHDLRYSVDCTQDPRRARLRAPQGRLRAAASPRPCSWYRDNRAWWEPLKHRATLDRDLPGLVRRPARFGAPTRQVWC